MTVSTDQNQTIVAGLEPASVWAIFSRLASTPRPSGSELAVRELAHAIAAEAGLESREDAAGNIVIEAPGRGPAASAPPVVLQAHLDMVAEANAGVTHDFERDPIRLARQDMDGELWITADGTTLGADNGIGAALALAAALDPDMPRPPLEILLTSDEEVGMTGAKELEADFVRGRSLINLDSEDDAVLYIGCAGGCDATFELTLPLGDEAPAVRVAVTGLPGGHSGADIHLGIANANKVLARVLADAGGSARIAHLHGGSKRNAIPREAEAIVTHADAGKLEAAAACVTAGLHAAGHEQACVTVEPHGSARGILAGALINLLRAIPSGVLAVVPEMPELVETSNNLSTMNCAAEGDELTVTIGCLSRSSSMAGLDDALDGLSALAALSGARVRFGNRYGGWQPSASSPLLSLCRTTYRSCFGTDAEVTAIHAGLECGILGERLGGADMISFGPMIRGAHSPDERVSVPSVAKIWTYLVAVLGAMS